MKIRIKYNFQNFIGGEILKKCGKTNVFLTSLVIDKENLEEIDYPWSAVKICLS